MHGALKATDVSSTIVEQSQERLRQAEALLRTLATPLEKKTLKLESLLQKLWNGSWNLKYRYLKGLRRELKKLKEKKIKRIDPQLLEDGTHELRRSLRWAVMGFIYPQGLFQYAPTAEPIVPSQYTQLQPDLEGDPVTIPYHSLALLSDWVGQLGKIKDQGLLKTYRNNHQSLEESLDWNKSFPAAIDATKQCLVKITQDKSLTQLRKALKIGKN